MLKERERETDRQRDRETETDRDRDRENLGTSVSSVFNNTFVVIFLTCTVGIS